MKFEVLKKESNGSITVTFMELIDIHTWKETVFDINTNITSYRHYVVFRFKNTLADVTFSFKLVVDRECTEDDMVNIWDTLKELNENLKQVTNANSKIITESVLNILVKGIVK